MDELKKPITYVLAVFLVMSIFVIASKAIIESARFDEDDIDRLADRLAEKLELERTSSRPAPQDDYVAVYYLRGEPCPTCETMEFLAKKTLEDHFAEAVASGEIVWEEIDYREQEHQALAKRFDVVTSTLLLVRYENGEVVEHENLVEIWDLYNQPERYVQYVKKELEAFFDASSEVSEDASSDGKPEETLIEPSKEVPAEEADRGAPLPGLP
jgi:thiol-disulfide isomerase/thioredoxin